VQKEGHTVDLRGTMSSLENGSYFFRTVKPQYYPIPIDGPVGKVLNSLERHPFRPAHIHFMVKAEGYEILVTHVFIDGDKYLESDTVFAVKKSLIRKLEHGNDTETGEKCFYLNFDIVMEKII
jgi:hydroxyquinol 1,2-dioxygenase